MRATEQGRNKEIQKEKSDGRDNKFPKGEHLLKEEK